LKRKLKPQKFNLQPLITDEKVRYVPNAKGSLCTYCRRKMEMAYELNDLPICITCLATKVTDTHIEQIKQAFPQLVELIHQFRTSISELRLDNIKTASILLTKSGARYTLKELSETIKRLERLRSTISKARRS